MVTNTQNLCSAINLSRVHTHSSGHTHTHTMNTHLEQRAAIYALAPGEQLGVWCLAQGNLIHGIEGGESAVHLLLLPTILAGLRLELTTFELRVRLSGMAMAVYRVLYLSNMGGTMQAGICYKYSTGGEHSENLSAALFPKVIQNPNRVLTWHEQSRLTDSRLQHQYTTRDNGHIRAIYTPTKGSHDKNQPMRTKTTNQNMTQWTKEPIAGIQEGKGTTWLDRNHD